MLRVSCKARGCYNAALSIQNPWRSMSRALGAQSSITHHASSGGAECSSALVNLKDALCTLAEPWTVTCADADTAGACSALAGLSRAGCLACACVVCAWAWRIGRLLADAGMLTDNDLIIVIPAQPCFCPQCAACWQILKQLCWVMLRSSCRS